eukprot:c3703_g1_i1.p1 GENE.c3703_g1_i1~~c3703_g1_i1.p1  ORF type:complete len:254 (+),score=68.06 c3703_g1_i1:1-762(+)
MGTHQKENQMSEDVLKRLADDARDKNKTITVTFFRHNQKNDKGKTYIWNLHHQFKTFEQMRLKLASDIHGPTGPVQRIYDLAGTKLTSLDEVVDHGIYICCGGDAFSAAGIPHAANPDAAAASQSPAEAQAPHHEEDASEGRVIDKEEIEKMKEEDIQQQKTKTCFFYPAEGQGVKTDKGVSIIINPTRYRTVDQVIAEVRGKVRLVTGVIQVLYDIEGHKLGAVAELKDQGRYICSIQKPFSKSMVPSAALA